MTTKRPDASQLLEAHDKIRAFAKTLECDGYTAPQICDALMAAGVNSAVLVAGHEAAASCLFEWAVKVQNLSPAGVAEQRKRSAAASKADAMLDDVLKNFHSSKPGH